MVNPLEIDIETAQRQHQANNKRQKELGGAARTLVGWLKATEDEVELSHLLHSLEENKDDVKQLLNCIIAVTKFANKAVKVNRSDEWLQAIEQIFLNIEKWAPSSGLQGQKIPFVKLCIAKFYCLSVQDNSNREAEECLHQAIRYSLTNEERVEVSLTLAQYYEDVSEYKLMKNYLEVSYQLCRELSNPEQYLAHIWLLQGHYYFFQFSFHRARRTLMKAKNSLKLIVSKNQNNARDSERSYRLLSDCLHYIGRTYHEEYDFLMATNYYIDSQNKLEKSERKHYLAKEWGATAFYHLRLGQILEICRIKDSAHRHYIESQKIFEKYQVSKSGAAQVNLALANMIGSEADSQANNQKSAFKDQEKQIRQSAKESSDTGYHRGYLLALLQLFVLYMKTLKFHLALPLIWKAFTSDEFKKSGGPLLLYRYVKKIMFGIFYKIRFLIWSRFCPNRVLHVCSCPIHHYKQTRNKKWA